MNSRARSTRLHLALMCAGVAIVSGTALAADVSTPVACGSNGCTHLSTATLQGLLTLPGALQPAEPPPARPYILFRVVDLRGATHEVVYVRRNDDALLGFADGNEWRLVPADDARLLADAVAGNRPTRPLRPERRPAGSSPPTIPAGGTQGGSRLSPSPESPWWRSPCTGLRPQRPAGRVSARPQAPFPGIGPGGAVFGHQRRRPRYARRKK